ncbi:MAG: hypothetical protein V3U26_02985 [Dehalococcoidia bacterium]
MATLSDLGRNIDRRFLSARAQRDYRSLWLAVVAGSILASTMRRTNTAEVPAHVGAP